MAETQLEIPQPAIIVIFGITGDLAQRKLLPALYHLLKDGLLDERTVIVGISRRDVSADQLLEKVELCVNEIDKVCDPEGIRKIRSALRMHHMSLVNDTEYAELKRQLDAIETEQGVCMNRLYYLSIPPQMFTPIVRGMGQNGLNQSCQHGTAAARLLVEKPFGYDLASARELIRETSEWFPEEQLFRIDHYLAKETVQNILAFRMYNPIFTSVWNNQHITAIDITAFEKIDIEGRATFYEEVGALRDFIQSHLLQLLAVVAMDLPDSLSSADVHAQKLRLLEAIEPVSPDQVRSRTIRGQYEGYRTEVNNPTTTTETYAAIELRIDNERWQNIPVRLRTGKALSEKRTDVAIQFRDNDGDGPGMGNRLVFRIQPSEGISLTLLAKKPGYSGALEPVTMDFDYQYAFDAHGHPDAYARVLVDAARGDHTLFTTSDEVVAAWRVVEHIQQAWSRDGDGLTPYPKGANAMEPGNPTAD
ncbi:MAG TPA: glucose-6-phosphate dehydrogenase [Candidatus Limnocylindrales bacterium]|nr:glucose-6-phosphate dehydrogenase [Candidatus Limnocylindrales bacterium]